MNKQETNVGSSRERMMETAVALMRQTGLSGAGINEIVRNSCAPKGSVYHHFPGGKAQIVEEGLAAYSTRVVAFINANLSSKHKPDEKVKALFNAFAERIEQGEFRHSCPAGTVCLDLDAQSENLRLAVAGAFDQYMMAIAAHFPFKSRARSKSFAGLMLTTIEGAYIRGRADRSSNPFREAGTWLAELAKLETSGN